MIIIQTSRSCKNKENYTKGNLKSKPNPFQLLFSLKYIEVFNKMS